MILAYRLTGAQRYLDAASRLADYSVGLNPLGTSYVTGLGARPPVVPLQLDSYFTAERGLGPVPGIVVYGPMTEPSTVDYQYRVWSKVFPDWLTLPEQRRYCDFVVGFESKSDAEQFLCELRERLTKSGLELHPDKTRLIEFGRYAAQNRERRGQGAPETFDFLGFTHYCGKTRGGWFVVKRRTMRKRMRRKLKECGRWQGRCCRSRESTTPIPSSASSLRPEVGARCGSAARWDLCGGRRETGVPTAIRSPSVARCPGR